MSFLCDVTSTIEPDVFNKQNRSYSHRWQSRPSNKSFLATSPDCSFLRRRLAAVTFQKASFTFLKLCIDRVDASYASVGWFSSVMGADVVAGWASPASRRIIISIPAWDFSDLTRFLHRGHIFSCQTSLKCFFFLECCSSEKLLLSNFIKQCFYICCHFSNFSFRAEENLLQRFNHHVTSFTRLQKSVISADWSRQIIKLERGSISHRLIWRSCTGL